MKNKVANRLICLLITIACLSGAAFIVTDHAPTPNPVEAMVDTGTAQRKRFDEFLESKTKKSPSKDGRTHYSDTIYPEDYAGMYVNAEGQIVVALVGDKNQAEASKSELAAYAAKDGLKVEYVKYSLNELNRVMDILTNLMDDNKDLGINAVSRLDMENRVSVGVIEGDTDMTPAIKRLVGKDAPLLIFKSGSPIEDDIEYILEWSDGTKDESISYFKTLEMTRILAQNKPWIQYMRRERGIPYSFYVTPSMIKNNCDVVIGTGGLYLNDGSCTLRQVGEETAKEFRSKASSKAYDGKNIYVSKREKDKKSQSFLWQENGINFLLKFYDVESIKDPLSHCTLVKYNIVPQISKLSHAAVLYEDMSENSAKLGTLPAGTRVNVWEEHDKWLMVGSSDKTGYIRI